MREFLHPPAESPAAAGPAPSFSVVVPAYNAASTIGEAVESALEQTLPPLEVVVCDDGSTDDLDAALADFRERIVLMRKANGGEGSAKDTASRAATGEFVVVLDADDAFLPERLEALGELARARPDLDILTTDAFLEADGKVVRRAYGGDWTFEVEDQRRGILERNFVFGAAAIRRKRLLEAGSFDATLRYAADWDLWIRMILGGSRAGLVAEPLYRYRIGPGALSSSRTPLVRGFVDVLERAASRTDLQEAERRTVERSIAARRKELTLLELDEALDDRTLPARHRALAALGAAHVPARARFKAAAALVAPGATSRLRSRRRRAGWVGAGGTFVRGPVRLTVYTDAEEIGGAEVSLGHLVAGLDRRYEVSIAGVDQRVVAYLAERRAGAKTRVLKPVRRKYDLRDVVQHIRAVQQLEPDLVHVSMKTPWACQYGILAAMLGGVRFVLVEQSLFPAHGELIRLFMRVAGRRAAAVVAVGDRSAREIERAVHLPAGSVRTIRNGVPDVERTDPPTLPFQGPVIGAVGRLDSEKGFDDLLRAMRNLPANAVVVGEGPYRPTLEALATELHLGDRLLLTGWQADPGRYYQAFTIFCLPSRIESFPLTVVEAMLAGRPVVATRVGSVAEAVLEGETGLLVPPDDPHALAVALDGLLDDSVRREEMGRRGRAFALRHLTAERMVESFDQLYQEILG